MLRFRLKEVAISRVLRVPAFSLVGFHFCVFLMLMIVGNAEMENSNSEDLCGVEQNEECRINDPASTSSSYRLFGRQASVHQMMGGGKGILSANESYF